MTVIPPGPSPGKERAESPTSLPVKENPVLATSCAPGRGARNRLASGTPRRYLAVYLPTWPTDRLARRRGRRVDRRAGRASSGQPAFVLLVTSAHNQRVVAACCGASLAAGVRAGMSVAHATALLPPASEVLLRDYEPAADAASLATLARWAIRFAPTVAPDQPDGLMLDVTGCQRLYGGDDQLAALVSGAFRRLRLNAFVAVAPTIGAAWALARYGWIRRTTEAQREHKKEGPGTPAVRPVSSNCAAVAFTFAGDVPGARGETGLTGRSSFPPGPSGPWLVVDDAEWPDLFVQLPVAALRVDSHIVDELAEVGIDVIGQLLEVPRDEIASRFGGDVLMRIDQAQGSAMETLRSVRQETPPAVALRFAGPTTQFEAVQQAAQRLVEKLASKLLKREAGARRLILEVERLNEDLRPEFAHQILTLSRPSRDAKHLWALLRPRIERLHLGEGVERLVLTAERIAPLPHEQERLDGVEDDDAEAATSARLQEAQGQLVDLLESKLRPDAVLACEPVETHVPEAAFRFHPASEAALRVSPSTPRRQPRTRQRRQKATHHADSDAPGPTATDALPGDRPTILFDTPERARVTLLQPEGPVIGLQWHRLHRIRTAIGPERIGRRWWQFAWSSRQPARDYYRLQDDQGLWLWVYRSRLTGRWFIHGVWG